MSPKEKTADEKLLYKFAGFNETLVVSAPVSEEHAWVGQAKPGLLWLHHFYFYTFITALDFARDLKLLHAAFENSTGALVRDCSLNTVLHTGHMTDLSFHLIVSNWPPMPSGTF